MRKTTIISVTSDLQLEVPPEIRSKLRAGDEFIIWEEGENIFFQKLQTQKSISDLRSHVQSLEPDPDQPTLAELAEVVREYRQEH
jgi:bifunctional DNA-binding transcriptional regulator/antitoxin component of YhaV-PrlF toxin-antitoxin module